MQKITEIWIDALEFDKKGGWKEDTQHVHLMGSGYLVAADKPGVPVEDAAVTVQIPQSDTYRIWVRTRNWLRPHDPGKFQLLVNGQNNGKVLGAMPSDAWIWEIAGDYELAAGELRLALHDLTGYFGRCAALLITNDFDYTPSREVDRLQKDRARIKGLPPETQKGGDYDVIVAGGGPGGVPAAIAAARKGMKTLLLQNRPMLGGNASQEVGVTMDGAEGAHIYARETGIAEEIRRLRDRDPSFQGDWTRAMETLTAAEENLTVLCDHHVCQTEMASRQRIRGVVAQNIRTLCRTRFTGKVFIDCTGDGWMGYYAGAKYRMGRESAAQYGEFLAPPIADTMTMSGCIRAGKLPFYYTAKEPVPYHAPAWVPALAQDDENFGRRIPGDGGHMHWWLEIPNTYDDMYDGEQSRDALLLAILGYYDHIKNYWSEKEKAACLQLQFPSVFVGRRESRRFIGDYVLTQDDCLHPKAFEDTISYTGWHLDVHHPEGLYSGKQGPMYCAFQAPMPNVPMRCLYSVNIENLLFAGRNISVSHIALGTTRLENTIATFGQAVGTAAAMCVRYDKTPRQICREHIGELQQQLLRDDQYIPGLKNQDPGDPCLTATATASSVKTDELFQTQQGIDGDLHPLDVDRCVSMCFEDVFDQIDGLYLRIHSANPEPTPLKVHAFIQGHSSASFYDESDTAAAEVMVPPMGEQWVKVPIRIPLPKTDLFGRCFIRVWVEKTPGLSWRSVKMRSIFEHRGQRSPDGQWELVRNECYRCTHIQPVEELADCGPHNVINGISRIRDAAHYEWVSDPRQALPQWIGLELREKTPINSVSLAFDTDLTNPGTCWHKESKAPGVYNCVKAYRVEVFAGDRWHSVADIRENFQRKRTHRFDTLAAEKLRVTVTETWGDPSARIMEIRAALD